MNTDALHKEYFDIQRERNGISPKVSLWAKLNDRMEEIKKLLGKEVITKNEFYGRTRKEHLAQRATYFQNKMWSKTGKQFVSEHQKIGNRTQSADILVRPNEKTDIIRAKSKPHSKQYVLSKGGKIGDGRVY